MFIYETGILKFGDLLGVWKLVIKAKFQHNISKMIPARQKTSGEWDMNIVLQGNYN